MPFPSYLSPLGPPPIHANAYRRALRERVDFSQRLGADAIAEQAARMFLPSACLARRRPSGDGCGTQAPRGMAPVKLQFVTDKTSAEVSTLVARFDAIASDQALASDAARGRAVLRAIAEKIRPALETGAVGRTRMAHAAALEIAAAIANPKTMTIGWRAAVDAADGLNPMACKLGSPAQWGVSIVAQKGEGRVTLCESAAWDRYHWHGESLADAKARGGDADGEGNVRAISPHNVICQAGLALVADVQTTFAVKTQEWWLTRVLLRRKDQRATVGAKIRMVAFESSEVAVHEALAYEDATWRHAACNWLAWLCRLLSGIGSGRVGKREYAHLNKFRPLRDVLPPPPPEVQRDEGNWDAMIAQCERTRAKKAELLGKDARRAAARTGTWSGDSGYAGKVDLKLRFVSPTGRGSRVETLDYERAQDETTRRPLYEAFPMAALTERLLDGGGQARASGGARADDAIGLR
ncbi:hypothetical protein K6V92_23685 [Cupriavidus respiraculi]|uniref:hypothetical protein n=1 Tax=Cupriavidus respiraculi TaxID=195930 RepID=UPI001C986A8F|nr:hypothetical protein [Cupriavidus respiraculi]MBY4949611.1 hypothetical protein [Cupriavidus respiraculi]